MLGFMSWTVRRARPGDAEEIARINVEGWRASYRGIVSGAALAELDVQRVAEEYRGVIDMPDPVAVFLAVCGKRIAAFCGVCPARDASATPTPGAPVRSPHCMPTRRCWAPVPARRSRGRSPAPRSGWVRTCRAVGHAGQRSRATLLRAPRMDLRQRARPPHPRVHSERDGFPGPLQRTAGLGDTGTAPLFADRSPVRRAGIRRFSAGATVIPSSTARSSSLRSGCRSRRTPARYRSSSTARMEPPLLCGSGQLRESRAPAHRSAGQSTAPVTGPPLRNPSSRSCGAEPVAPRERDHPPRESAATPPLLPPWSPAAAGSPSERAR